MPGVRLRVFTEPQEGATYEQQRALACLAEELDFDAYFRSDHYLAFGGAGDGRPGPTDAWVTLAGLARDTSRVRLGTLVSPVTFRWPGPLAISVAQVDAMSGGRVDLGIGAGWNDEEHRAHAIPFPPTKVRFEMLEDTLEIVTRMWATPEGERFSYAGPRHRVDDCPGLPKPAQRPRPPIIMGGYGTTRTPRLAARFADEFNLPFPPLDYYRAGCDHVRAACEEIGRDPASLRYTVALVVCVGADEAEIARRAAAIGREVDELRAHGVAGTPAEAVERIRAFADAGAETVYLQVLDLDDHDHLRLLAAEVVPHVGAS